MFGLSVARIRSLKAAWLLFMVSLISFGLSVETLWVLIGRQLDLAHGIHENAVWCAFQLDREAGDLIASLRAAEAGAQEGAPEVVTTRFDIVISRQFNLEMANFPVAFLADTNYAILAASITNQIVQLDQKFGKRVEAGRLDASTIQEMLKDVLELRSQGKVLVSETNTLQEKHRMQDRESSLRTYQRLTVEVVGLALTLFGVIWMLARQLKKDEATQRDLERMNLGYKQAAEAADTANRTKSAFLATMSHEIRTPLNGIIGTVELLDDSSLSRERRASLDTIRDCGTSLLDLVDDILDFSRLESGSLSLEQRTFDISTVVEAALDIVSQKARRKGIGLIGIYPELQITGDEARLRQALVNLCGNAVKFTEKGDVVVVARCVKDGDQRARLLMEVHDTGIGISPKEQKSLFKEFHQVDGSINRRFGGSGLGLAISRRLIETMGGSIGVESVLGQGSRFWFTLPLSADAVANPPEIPWPAAQVRFGTSSPMAYRILQSELGPGRQTISLWNPSVLESVNSGVLLIDVPTATQHPLSPGELAKAIVFGFNATSWEGRARWVIEGPLTIKSLQQALTPGTDAQIERVPRVELPVRTAPYGHVLVVEDNRINQQVALRLLEKMGVTVELAEDGALALARAAQGGIDLVLMDMQMPVMDGLESTRRIRQLPDQLGAVPIVGLTANAFASDRDACLAAGMNDFQSKPVNRQKLEMILMAWLSTSGRENAPSDSAPPSPPREAPTGGPTVKPSAKVGEVPAEATSTAWIGDILDRNRIELMTGELGAEMIDKLTSLFWVDLENLMVQLRSPAAVSDGPATRRAFHTIKGSAETIGFKAISEATVRAGELFRQTGAVELLELERAVRVTRGFLATPGAV
jgi:two-component system, sensor histidine kinase and response regulator